MSRHVRRTARGIQLVLDPMEVDLLRTLRQGLDEALTSPSSSDPVVQRLFPSAVDGDEQTDEEVRDLLRDDLLAQRRHGLDALDTLLDRGARHRGQIRFDLRDDEPHLVLGVLNDVRLALGARIGIEDLDRASVEEDDPLAARLAIIDHLAWIQEQLIAAIDPEAVGEP